MDADLVRQLSTGEGWGLLQALPPYDEGSALSLQRQLRDAGFAPDLVAAALAQSRLRARAQDKFGEFADGMMFTTDGLEQATRLSVAARHAQRFREAGIRSVHDLGCGIGSDAMALSGLDIAVTAVDADEATAAVAQVNLRHWAITQVEHAAADAFVPPTGPGASEVGVWFDPSRRTPGVADSRGRTRRLFRLEDLSPSWSLVQEMARSVPATGAKLSPGFPHAARPPGTEAQWTSYAGEVLECALWWGPLVRTSGRTALVLDRDGSSAVLTEADGDPVAPKAERLSDLGPWLYEPDRAVIRAGLTGTVTAAVDGVELDEGVGYVAARTAAEVPGARRFAVEEVMPFAVKALRAWLADRDITRITLKKRGVSLDADLLRRQLRVTEGGRGQHATVVITRVRGQQVALVVRPG